MSDDPEYIYGIDSNVRSAEYISANIKKDAKYAVNLGICVSCKYPNCAKHDDGFKVNISG